VQLDPLGLAFFLLYWAAFVYSIVLHEIAHGWVAFRLGDPTAYQQGRLSLNPLRHIDPLRSVIMPVLFYMTVGFPFGGAKPVPVNPYLYRNLRWGTLLDSAAGPLTNLLLASFCALGLTISRVTEGLTPAEVANVPLTGRFFAACMLMNVFLAVFNMLPIPPLDGSHVLTSLLPRRLGEAFERLQSFGWWPIMIVVLLDGMMGGLILGLPMIYLSGLALRAMGTISDWHDYGQLLQLFSPTGLLKGAGT
jgi:Zn-dependent protease